MGSGDENKSAREICREYGIHYCEPGRPWMNWMSRAYHPHATEVVFCGEDGNPYDTVVLVHCPVCGHDWTRQLAQESRERRSW